MSQSAKRASSDAEPNRKRWAAAPFIGAMCGLCGTLIGLFIWSQSDPANIPAIVRIPLTIVAYPFFLPGGAITYFGIVGDNMKPNDFLRYTFPISLVINVIGGALLGKAYQVWRNRGALGSK